MIMLLVILYKLHKTQENVSKKYIYWNRIMYCYPLSLQVCPANPSTKRIFFVNFTLILHKYVTKGAI
jgi:hypothetical protein